MICNQCRVVTSHIDIDNISDKFSCDLTVTSATKVRSTWPVTTLHCLHILLLHNSSGTLPIPRSWTSSVATSLWLLQPPQVVHEWNQLVETGLGQITIIAMGDICSGKVLLVSYCTQFCSKDMITRHLWGENQLINIPICHLFYW